MQSQMSNTIQAVDAVAVSAVGGAGARTNGNRCDTCRKKVASALVMTCAKCTKKLCVSHIQCEMHNCEHDHKASGKELLRKQLDVGVLVDKLERV
jgi:hypothetical protein